GRAVPRRRGLPAATGPPQVHHLCGARERAADGDASGRAGGGGQRRQPLQGPSGVAAGGALGAAGFGVGRRQQRPRGGAALTESKRKIKSKSRNRSKSKRKSK